MTETHSDDTKKYEREVKGRGIKRVKGRGLERERESEREKIERRIRFLL